MWGVLVWITACLAFVSVQQRSAKTKQMLVKRQMLSSLKNLLGNNWWLLLHLASLCFREQPAGWGTQAQALHRTPLGVPRPGSRRRGASSHRRRMSSLPAFPTPLSVRPPISGTAIASSARAARTRRLPQPRRPRSC